MRAGFFWPWRSVWLWVLLLALAVFCGGLSGHCETTQPSQPLTPSEPDVNPKLVELLNLPWRTLYEDSMLLVERLQQRRSQGGDLLSSLNEAGGKLDSSESSSANLETLLSGAGMQLGELLMGLTGISSSLSGLRTDFGGLSSSLTAYFDLTQGQVRDLKGERDAARLQASAWRIAALVGGGVGVVSLAVLIIVLVAH